MNDFVWDTEAQGRLQDFIDGIGGLLGSDSRRASFGLYALGLLGEGERKSIEPIAARCCCEPEEVGARHQQLQHFVSNAEWSDHKVRQFAANYALAALTKREPVVGWIIDDTGFLKQGKHSVGVQRQYTGSAGKVANCQTGTSLAVSTRTMHVGIDFELYLPRSWTDDPVRRREARIPDDVEFKTKPQQALDMIRRAIAAGVPTGTVLADCGFGDSNEFRDGVRELGLHYAVGVEAPTKVYCVDRAGRKNGARISLATLAQRIRAKRRGGFRRITWRQGTRYPLWSRFAVQRVIPARSKGQPRSTVAEAVWLIVEWPDGEQAPLNYFFISLADSKPKQMVRLVKERYRTEALYQELKGEFGLDHFEGRRYRGWHHHVSAVLCVHAFLAAERSRRFPPSGRRTPSYRSVSDAA
jgi:SRSO17 transposase